MVKFLKTARQAYEARQETRKEMNLKQVGFSDLSESTLYPLLLRLEQQGKVTVERRPSPKGPSRKYYIVTEEGRQALLEFRQDWSQLCQLVEKIFKEEPDE